MNKIHFLMRRLIWSIPTLLGICLITFALIHLAPGDPIEAGTSIASLPISKFEMGALRRTYFLDLPLFYNSAPRGVEGRAAELISQLYGGTNDAFIDSAIKHLQRCGTACLSFLAISRSETNRSQNLNQSGRVERAILAIKHDHPNLGSSLASVDIWLSEVLPLLRPESLNHLAQQFAKNSPPDTELLRRGTASIPSVMSILLKNEGPSRQAASEVMSKLIGIDGRMTDNEAKNKTVFAFWREWWFQHRRDYQHFSSWDRWLGRVTETQFGKWISRLLTLQFGVSTFDGRPVRDKIAEALPITLLLSFLSLSLAYFLSIPLGVFSAIYHRSLKERIITLLIFILYSLPTFWVAMMLILLFGGVGYLDWFPIYGLITPGLEAATGWTWFGDRLHHLVLPVVCLTYGSLAVISRFQKNAMLEVLRQDYILAARAKGLSEYQVIFKHGLRNALLPTITLLGLQFPFLVSGSVIIEKIFNVPGMGWLAFQAFLHRDYPVIMAISVLTAALTLFGLILSDLFYAIADPRISLVKQS